MPDRKMAVVFLVTENVDTLVPFYREILGLKVTRHEPSHSAWFDTGATSLCIHRPESEQGEMKDLLPKTEVLIWFQPSEGVPAAVQALEKAGVELLRPKKAQNYFYLRDPEGRLVGFHQPT